VVSRREKILSAAVALLVVLLPITIIVTSEGGKTTTVRVGAKVPSAPPGDLNTVRPLKGGPAPQTEIRNAPNEGRLAEPHAVGGAQTYSCKQVYGGHLWSSRNGIRPTEFVVHYTAGNGTAENIDAYFRRTRAASATYLLEPSGHCIQEVPESEKPWTQLTANPYSISVEIVTTGWNVSRSQWLAMPIFRRGVLADLMRAAMTRHGIPVRRVDPVGCNFIPGYTDHNALECGNDHTDVLPNFPWDVLASQLHGPKPPTRHAQALCREYAHYRREVRAGTFPESRRPRAVAVRNALARHYRCMESGRAVRK
jgi:N-acetyl-anhydromuramyl-L-alanine amidase AmpD